MTCSARGINSSLYPFNVNKQQAGSVYCKKITSQLNTGWLRSHSQYFIVHFNYFSWAIRVFCMNIEAIRAVK